MQLMIESYCLTSTKLINEYLDIMKEINAEEIYKEKTDYDFEKENKYIHKIKFDKDLKASEIMEIKEMLHDEDDILSVWLENNDSSKELMLFNKDFEF